MALFARIGSAALALAICAWFALAIHTQHEFERGQAILAASPRLTTAELARADAALDAARTLNPDSGVELALGEAALHAGRTLVARRIVESVTRSEPLNVQAWLLLAEAAYGTRQPLAGTLVQLGRLDPLDTRPH